MAQITYADKVALNVNSNIADINKVNASDMNEIKQVVNDNANTLDNKISNTYGTSQTEGYSQEYINSRRTTLYENDTWSGNQGDITLSDSTANYDYLEIFYATRSLGGEGYKSVKIANPNGKTIDLDMVIRKADDNVMYFISNLYNISGTTLTLKAIGSSYVYNNSSNNVNTSTNYIYVKKVVGIKE